jgi:pimeloyl-ACP methyl ester carboxylesterase
MKQTCYMEGSPRIAYDKAGTGPLVVFLHGLGGYRLNWEPQIGHFSQKYCTVAWDGRGYGLSGDSPSTLQFSDYSHDLRRLLDHMGAARAHLVGISMGGMILQDFYSRHADRVATLVLADTNCGMACQPEEFKREFVTRRMKLANAGKITPEMAEEFARALCAPEAPHTLWASLRDSLSMLRLGPYKQSLDAIMTTDFRALRPQSPPPTLVVVGEKDDLTPIEATDEIVTRFPGSQKVVITGAGHASSLEQAGTFNRVVGEFLDKHASLASRVD